MMHLLALSLRKGHASVVNSRQVCDFPAFESGRPPKGSDYSEAVSE
ncbi:hypothetical protein KKC22_01645 [Myxococcota bacterium]|nr:hypothetical protein [Myxococcota bacterium]